MIPQLSDETIKSILAELDPDRPLGRLASTIGELAALGLETLKAGGTAGNPAGDSPKRDPWLTPSQTCEYLQCSLPTLNTLRDRYEIESVGNGRGRRYRLSEIERLMAAREGGE